MQRRSAFLFPLLCLAACAAEPTEDDSLEEAIDAPTDSVKADRVDFGGLYEMTSGTLRTNDIPFLQLGLASPRGGADRTSNSVRARCYHTGCSALIPEEDRFDIVKKSDRTYVRFWSFRIDDSSGERQETPVVADAYEIEKMAAGIRLRKTYTSRWFSLIAVDEHALCDESGGSWDAHGCTCPRDPNATGYDGTLFVPGVGGCYQAVVGSEDACDATGGDYTDDDATPIGTFCRCGIGRTMTESGCAAI